MSRTTRLSKALTAACPIQCVQYDDKRNTSDKQNTKYNNISDTSNDLLSKHSR